MATDEFRDVDELTHEELIEREIDEIVTKPAPKETPKKEVIEEKKVTEKPKKTVVEKKTVEKTPTKRKVTKRKMVKRKTAKKTKAKTKPVPAKKEDDSGKWLLIIAAAVLLIALVIAAIFILNAPEDINGTNSSNVAALVNGKPIYQEEVQFRQLLLQRTQNPLATEEDALQDAIDEEILFQHADSLEFTASEDEVEDVLIQSLGGSASTSELRKQIEADGYRYEQVLSFYKKDLIVFKMINETIIGNTTVSDKEAETYYQMNKEDYTVPAFAQVKHILIAFDRDTDEETLSRAENIRDMIADDNSNFCDLVENYTDDVASKESCGEYNVTKNDPIAPEFLKAAFEMEPEDIEIVKTQFGYHIMYKVEDYEARQLDFEDVQPEVESVVKNRMIVENYQTLLQGLKEDAVIEIYTDEQPAEDTKEEDTKPAKQVVETKKSQKQSLAKCLEDSGAVMYSVYWSPDTETQLEVFGDDADEITVIECDPDREDAKIEDCSSWNLTVYPTWVIDGEKYEGLQSLRGLSQASNCNY